ncbi:MULTISPECIES: VacJ family lipoprotein [unclassified Caballeronia]|jgi:phospholipid-binding lipoprotein MlaA|uniref:MlaA family lipoprotein n=1 Tax=unclassified Caballeronia TaxID=2646786 RepID=UPI001FD44D8F|nr:MULTISPECIES: VacJ family lipoprotein [unclassified Caballeronia]MDR5774974.1 VacJ family lipoprotein [Caballeronia sp. LZ002]MDR5801263.1 VacJ family lipoprotein [Caballeronia sp. LZ001]MDR5850410.1 VacJ family lipoprotein [Caballeronia sp. LZ003]
MRTALAAGAHRKLATSVVIASALLVAGCATGPDRNPRDPLEPMNRTIFKFNDTLDTYVAKPVAQFYVDYTPSPFRTAVSNFFSNIGDFSNFANNLLQLKITDATQDLMRIAINSVFGLGGLIDIASPAGLPKHHQDFGLTLGHYGVPSGPYLVIPLLGPSSFRDSTTWLVDWRVNPISYADNEIRWPLYGINFVSARADLIGATDLLSQAALDKYAFVRDAYTQRRQYLLTGGGTATLPDYGDEGASAPDAASAPGVPGATGGGSAAQGLPNYADPGAAAAPAGGMGGKSPAPAETTPSSSSKDQDVPQYEDPGAK